MQEHIATLSELASGPQVNMRQRLSELVQVMTRRTEEMDGHYIAQKKEIARLKADNDRLVALLKDELAKSQK